MKTRPKEIIPFVRLKNETMPFRVVYWDPQEKREGETVIHAKNLIAAMKDAQHFFNYPRRVIPL